MAFQISGFIESVIYISIWQFVFKYYNVAFAFNGIPIAIWFRREITKITKRNSRG